MENDTFQIWAFDSALAFIISSFDEKTASIQAEKYPATIYFFAELKPV